MDEDQLVDGLEIRWYCKIDMIVQILNKPEIAFIKTGSVWHD